jgi:hypothetical protein
MFRWRKESVLDVYNLVAAVFLFVSPWLYAFSLERVELDMWVSGIAIAVVSLAAAVAFTEWEEWITLALGLWLVISPWVLGFLNPTAVHVAVIVGGIVAYLALLELWLIHYGEREEAARPG